MVDATPIRSTSFPTKYYLSDASIIKILILCNHKTILCVTVDGGRELLSLMLIRKNYFSSQFIFICSMMNIQSSARQLFRVKCESMRFSVRLLVLNFLNLISIISVNLILSFFFTVLGHIYCVFDVSVSSSTDA